MPLDDIRYFFSLAVLALVIGGISSLALTFVFGAFTGPLMTGILAMLIAVLIIYIAKYTEVDGLRFVEWIVLFLMIGGLGTIITTVFPTAGTFILSSTTFTVSGLGFTVLYVLIADSIGDKVF